MMKLIRRLFVGLVAILAVVLVLLLALHRNGSIQADIVIDRPSQQVWKVLTTTADYPLWNPMISSLNGELRQGNVVDLTLGYGADSMTFHPRILMVRANRELQWKGHVLIPGVFDGDHRFLLESLGSKTCLVQSEKFTGLLAGRLTEGILRSTTEQMKLMNLALKKRAESLPEP